MPKYEIVSFSGVWSWVRQLDGSYLVDADHLEEFIELWGALKK